MAPITNKNDEIDVTLTTGTTTFQDDGDISRQPVRLQPLKAGIQPFDKQDIAEFMAKPALLSTVTWNSADAAGTVKYAGSVATLMEAQSYWNNKLQGYKLVRGTAVVKVVLNCNPFQQGRLLLSFLPCQRHLPSSNVAARYAMLSQYTTMPNVELDAGETSVEMHIPYVTPSNYYDRVSGDYDWGTFRLVVLSPLDTGSTGEFSAEVALFLSFKDFELAAPIFQVESSLKSGAAVPTRAIRVEKNKAAKGIVSGAATNVASIADSLGNAFGFLPGVSAAANAVAGASSVVGDIAALFGFSKPKAYDTVSAFSNNPFRYLSNASGTSAAGTFAYNHDHFLEPCESLFGHDLDEMSFAYLKTIPALFRTFSLTTSQVSDQEVFTSDISPASSMYSATDTNGVGNILMRHGTPLFMLHRYFSAYRGSVKVTFKFVKTKLHSGRLAVSWTPRPGLSPTIAQGIVALREVIDLKDSDEITLTLPYLFGENYLNCVEGSTHDDIDVLGHLSVRVLTELRCPIGSVSETVQCLMYIQPGDDFEYAGIGNGQLTPFTPESGLYSRTHLKAKNIGNSAISDESLLPNAISFGDPIMSVKQLLNASRNIYWGSLPGNSLAINPDSSAIANNGGLSSSPQFPTGVLRGDYFPMLKGGYMFSRGGFRITCANNQMSAGTAGTVRAYLSPAILGATAVTTPPAENAVSDTTTINRVIPMQPSNTAQRGVLDVCAPGWQRGKFRLNKHESNLNTIMVTSYGPEVYSESINIYADTTLPSRGWVRSTTDDFQLGYFVGFYPYAITGGL